MAEWRPVVGFEGFVEVSDEGHVRKVACRTPLIPRVRGWGYSEVSIHCRGLRHYRVVHAMVLEAFVERRPPKHVGNHKNGIKTDNRLENLEWVTAKENRQHAGRTGLWNHRGERHAASKITEEDVRQIRESSESTRVLAERYGMTTVNIRCIQRRKTWAHVS